MKGTLTVIVLAMLAITASTYFQFAMADEASVFHLRGECIAKAKALFEKIDEKSNENCVETFFKGSNYNTSDNRCYLKIDIAEDKIIHDAVAEHTMWKHCKTATAPQYFKTLLYDVQREEDIAYVCTGECFHGHGYDGYILERERPAYGWLSISSEYTKAENFINSKLK